MICRCILDNNEPTRLKMDNSQQYTEMVLPIPVLTMVNLINGDVIELLSVVSCHEVDCLSVSVCVCLSVCLCLLS